MSDEDPVPPMSGLLPPGVARQEDVDWAAMRIEASPGALPRRPADDPFTRAGGPDWLTDYFAKMMPAAEQWFAEQARGTAPEPSADGFLVPSGMHEELLEAVKLSSFIQIPDELAMAYGLIPDTRPKPPPMPWRWRLRNRVTGWRERAARRAYKLIAGDWPDNGEDDW